MVTRGHSVFKCPNPQIVAPPYSVDTAISDLFLHALFARVALTSNNNIEFETIYCKETNTIELLVPPDSLKFFDQITGLKRGPNFKAYIDWLIGSTSIAPIIQGQDPNFVSASALSVWTGATQGSLTGNQIILMLPPGVLSGVGYNTKIDSSFSSGHLSVYLIWIYDSGNNNSFQIKTNVRATKLATGINVDADNTVSISTLNLLKGDIRETLLIQTPIVAGGDIINITLSRNFESNTDPATDLVGIVGLRLKL